MTEAKLLFETYRIRLVEERIAAIYPSDRVQSPVHLSNGQEAIAVGLCANLSDNDLVFGTYRSHALYLAKGGDLRELMAELFGKVTGCTMGKGGSMHLAAKDVGVYGSSAIVASTIPHAVGAAYAASLRNSQQLVVCFFGEGATGTGVYHECLNFASIHQLPLLFVCEYNGLAIYSRTKDIQAFDIVAHANSYGIITSVEENGFDVTAVFSAARREIENIRSVGGPRLLLVHTCRYKEHVGPGDTTNEEYRPHSMLEEWKSKDPLIVNIDRLGKFKTEIEVEIDDAIKFAEDSAFPEVSELLKDIV